MSENPDDSITVFWRPGCGFCSRLFAQLDRDGLQVTRINIWEEPDAASAVRALTGGSETVPTVVVRGLVMVNPSGDQVMAAVRAHAPGLLVDD